LSRSALLVGVIAVAAWAAYVPLRLRTALMLGLAGLCAAPIVLVALDSHDLTSDNVPLTAQDAAGHAWAPVLFGMVAVAFAAGFAISYAMPRVSVPEPLRRRIGTGLLVVVALVPLAGIGALAVSSRGLFGQISHAWQSLVSTHAVVLNTPGRITQLGSSRPAYWHQGLDVGSHALLKGVGELGYGVARLRYTTSPFKTDQAHNYLIQTFADLGILGVVLTLALLAAWGRAALRPLALSRRWDELTPAATNERQGLVAMAIVVLAFGIHSCLDVTFYFPGIAIPVLLCAGWLAGRGPLERPVGRRASGRISVVQRPGAGALVTGLAAVALIGAWLMWQPLRSAQAMADAENHPETAFASARAAVSRDPLSIDPLYLLSELYEQSHDPAAARRELVKATQIQPANPRSWFLLGQLDYANAEYKATVTELTHALSLDLPVSEDTINARTMIGQSQAQLAAQAAAVARFNQQQRRRAQAAKRAARRAARRRTAR
jgi:hypothetical protein